MFVHKWEYRQLVSLLSRKNLLRCAENGLARSLACGSEAVLSNSLQHFLKIEQMQIKEDFSWRLWKPIWTRLGCQGGG